MKVNSYDSTSLSEGVRQLAMAERVVMHNGINYDHPVLAQFGYHFPIERIYDTLVVSRVVEPSLEGGHSLRAWGERLGFPKGEVDSFERYTEEMLEYCIQDVMVTHKLYDKLRTDVPPKAMALEHQVARIISSQERNGFAIDLPKAETLATELYGERKESEEALKQVFPPMFVDKGKFTPKQDNKKLGYSKGSHLTKVELQSFNPGSRQQIAKRLMQKYDWKPRRFTPSGAPEISETVLAGLSYPEAKAMHRYLRVEKMLGMLAGDKGWMKLHRAGRIHGSVNPCGTRTGRMTHRQPNVAQADSDPRMRELFIPRAGWKLCGIDAKGIEARILGHYLAKFDEGKFADLVVNGDFHSYNQKITGLKSRRNAKTLFYAFLFGAGDEKIGQVVFEDAPFKGKKAKVGKQTREKLSTGVTGLKELVTKCRTNASKRGYLKGLDGRHLYCPSVHTALNTLIQGAAAVTMKKALVYFDRMAPSEGWAYVANVHDEVQIEAAPHLAEQVSRLMVESIQWAGKELNLRCPMDGEYKIGNNWSETH